MSRILAEARRSPIPGGSGGRKATAGPVLLAIVSALYDRGDWAELESALADADNGNSSGLFTLADRYNQRDDKGHYTNLVDANTAINCADTAEKVPDSDRAEGAHVLAHAVPAVRQLARARPADLPAVAGAAGAAAGGAGGRGAAGAGDRHRQRPGHAVRVAKVLARTLASGRLLTWRGRGAHRIPEDARA